MKGHRSKGWSRNFAQVILHKSTIHLLAVNAILSEVQAFFWFDLECKVMGQNGGHVLVRRRSYHINP